MKYKKTIVKKKHKRSKNKRRYTKKVQLQKGGEKDFRFTVMSYNVLSRGSTFHQNHNYKFNLNNHTEHNLEHIHQTIERFHRIKDEIFKISPAK